jgi:hypothetical protein
MCEGCQSFKGALGMYDQVSSIGFDPEEQEPSEDDHHDGSNMDSSRRDEKGTRREGECQRCLEYRVAESDNADPCIANVTI